MPRGQRIRPPGLSWPDNGKWYLGRLSWPDNGKWYLGRVSWPDNGKWYLGRVSWPDNGKWYLRRVWWPDNVSWRGCVDLCFEEQQQLFLLKTNVIPFGVADPKTSPNYLILLFHHFINFNLISSDIVQISHPGMGRVGSFGETSGGASVDSMCLGLVDDIVATAELEVGGGV